MADADSMPFRRIGPQRPVLPVILAVPHAGRDYPAALLANAAVSRARLEMLEDRFVDLLVDDTPSGASGVIARNARAWIDLNRGEREIDPSILERGAATGSLLQSAKVRGGIGLIPHRIGASNLLRRRLSTTEVEARLASDYRPYHAAAADLLAQARSRFGVAVLLDCHSMPPLTSEPGRPPVRIVVGDRYGRSADSRFVDCIIAVAEAEGWAAGQNSPYSGGYTLDRHGRPADNIHAVQLEIDRSLYLEAGLRAPGAGLSRVRGFVARVVAALAEEALGPTAALAAE
jgi:N-formylglutamate amidohydrolase